MSEISFCENNFAYGTEELANKLENELDGVSVEVEACLGYCGDCALGPFALVDGELIQADSVEELYEMIKEEL
ncbi:hypothetical protein U472_10135 [Orenia metallireducens]|uniref:DUF1450 domain-containing protein n=1 Tax=Orenia metallireducens TaxID=1413210 RepID=A0A1C0A7Z3_9FIRM|nr:DUF1450 domain-containing protein [Orenia metallireducens]OCL26357.1 hypothetical protein U472_10135 [Orenia metallireducens]